MEARDKPCLPPPLVRTCHGIRFEETLHPEPFKMGRHSHDEAHMVLLFAGGIESYSYNRTSIATRSDLLFVPPGETHTSEYQGRVHGFYVQFRSTWWEQRAQQGLTGLPQATYEYRNNPPAHLAARLHQVFREQNDPLTPLLLEGLTIELLVAMARQSGDTEYTRSSTVGDTAPRWLLQARDYLHAHFTENLTVDTIAQAASIHPGHLMRAFRAHYHCTIGDYVRRLRVEHACRLLARPDTDLSLAQLALSLGFADQAHFCRTVKRVTGRTPTELRHLATGDVSMRQNTRA